MSEITATLRSIAERRVLLRVADPVTVSGSLLTWAADEIARLRKERDEAREALGYWGKAFATGRWEMLNVARDNAARVLDAQEKPDG